MLHASYPSNLTDAESEQIQPLLLPEKPCGKVREVNLQDILNGIFSRADNGIKWRALPMDFPAWQTLYGYFRVWVKLGVWKQINAALFSVGQTATSPRLEKAIHYLYEHLNQFYNFQGLHAYKEKFHPRWEPRYLVYPSLVALPDVMVALVRADSGDRLLDYFKPGA